MPIIKCAGRVGQILLLAVCYLLALSPLLFMVCVYPLQWRVDYLVSEPTAKLFNAIEIVGLSKLQSDPLYYFLELLTGVFGGFMLLCRFMPWLPIVPLIICWRWLPTWQRLLLAYCYVGGMLLSLSNPSKIVGWYFN